MSIPSDPDPFLNDPDPSLPKSNAPVPPPNAAPPAYPPYLYAPPRRTNGMAIASMVLGIVWIYWVGSILALIFGYQARKQIRERNESGEGMATAGIVLGWVGVGVLAAVLLLVVVANASSA